MADGTPSNICECLEILSQRMGMQGLLARLRNNQNYCTDSYCLDMLDRESEIPTAYGDSDSHVLTLMLGWAVLALVLYLIRNSYMDTGIASTKKSRREGSDDNGPDRQGIL